MEINTVAELKLKQHEPLLRAPKHESTTKCNNTEHEKLKLVQLYEIEDRQCHSVIQI